jgi:hypothetical protein
VTSSGERLVRLFCSVLFCLQQTGLHTQTIILLEKNCETTALFFNITT